LGDRIKIALLLEDPAGYRGVVRRGARLRRGPVPHNYLPTIGQTEISLDAYREVLSGEDFLDSFLLTVYVAGASTVTSTVLAVLA